MKSFLILLCKSFACIGTENFKENSEVICNPSYIGLSIPACAFENLNINPSNGYLAPGFTFFRNHTIIILLIRTVYLKNIFQKYLQKNSLSYMLTQEKAHVEPLNASDLK